MTFKNGFFAGKRPDSQWSFVTFVMFQATDSIILSRSFDSVIWYGLITDKVWNFWYCIMLNFFSNISSSLIKSRQKTVSTTWWWTVKLNDLRVIWRVSGLLLCFLVDFNFVWRVVRYIWYGPVREPGSGFLDSAQQCWSEMQLLVNIPLRIALFDVEFLQSGFLFFVKNSFSLPVI